MTRPKPHETPKELDAITDIVLAYKPKPKAKAEKKGNKRASKIAETKPSSLDLR